MACGAAPLLVIARSAATRQSMDTEPPPDGLPRLRLAMTVWVRGRWISGLWALPHSSSLRGAQRRGNPWASSHRPLDCHALRARNDGGVCARCVSGLWCCSTPRHCEERSDAAIHGPTALPSLPTHPDRGWHQRRAVCPGNPATAAPAADPAGTGTPSCTGRCRGRRRRPV